MPPNLASLEAVFLSLAVVFHSPVVVVSVAVVHKPRRKAVSGVEVLLLAVAVAVAEARVRTTAPGRASTLARTTSILVRMQARSATLMARQIAAVREATSARGAVEVVRVAEEARAVVKVPAVHLPLQNSIRAENNAGRCKDDVKECVFLAWLAGCICFRMFGG